MRAGLSQRGRRGLVWLHGAGHDAARVVDKFQAGVLRALAEPGIKDKLAAQGLEVRAGTAAEFGRFIETETQ